jgi:hypothetical protein
MKIVRIAGFVLVPSLCVATACGAGADSSAGRAALLETDRAWAAAAASGAGVDEIASWAAAAVVIPPGAPALRGLDGALSTAPPSIVRRPARRERGRAAAMKGIVRPASTRSDVFRFMAAYAVVAWLASEVARTASGRAMVRDRREPRCDRDPRPARRRGSLLDRSAAMNYPFLENLLMAEILADIKAVDGWEVSAYEEAFAARYSVPIEKGNSWARHWPWSGAV